MKRTFEPRESEDRLVVKRRAVATPMTASGEFNRQSAGLLDLPHEVISRLFCMVDLGTRVRWSMVSKDHRLAIHCAAPSIETLSIKECEKTKNANKAFLVNNQVAVELSDLLAVVQYWLTQREPGHSFEFTTRDGKSELPPKTIFKQLRELKQLRVVVGQSGNDVLQFRRSLFSLIRRSAGTLETLALGIPLTKDGLAAISQCGLLKSLSLGSRAKLTHRGPCKQLLWPSLPQLRRIHVENYLAYDLHPAIRQPMMSAVAKDNLHLSVDETSTIYVEVVSEMRVNMAFLHLSAVLDQCPRLVAFNCINRVIGTHQLPTPFEHVLAQLLKSRVAKPHRSILAIVPTHRLFDARGCGWRDAEAEFESLLPSIRWRGDPPTPAEDENRMASLVEMATAEGVVGLSVRVRSTTTVAVAEDHPLRLLPVALRSRRQFEITSPSLNIHLVLLPDNNADFEVKIADERSTGNSE